MELSRRSFLHGALVVPAASVLPAVAFSHGHPVLHGNGVDDDTDAFNAMLKGEPFVCEGEVICRRHGEDMVVGPGTYVVSSIPAAYVDDVGDPGFILSGTGPRRPATLLRAWSVQNWHVMP